VPLSSQFDDPDDPDVERASILIVDDLPEKLLVFETVLEDLGQDIVSVRSGGAPAKTVKKTVRLR